MLLRDNHPKGINQNHIDRINACDFHLKKIFLHIIYRMEKISEKIIATTISLNILKLSFKKKAQNYAR